MPGTPVKNAPASVKSGKKASRPSLYKKSPETAMNELFKEYLGSKSELIETLQDNGMVDALEATQKSVQKNSKDLKTYTSLNKKLVKGIVDSSTKLSAVVKSLDSISTRQKAASKAPKLTQTDKNVTQVTRQLSFVSTSLTKMRSLLTKQHRDILDRSLQHESDAYESKLRDQNQQNAYTPTFSAPTHGKNALEQRASSLFGKGFHFVTGAINEILQKSILHNKSPMMQENKPEEQWSPQHRNYMRTKDQLGSLLSIFKSGKTRIDAKPKSDELEAEAEPITKRLDQIASDITKGDEKVVKSVNSVNGTLKTIAQYFATQNRMMEDEDEAAELRRTKLEKDKKVAPPVVVNNVNQNGGGGMLDTAMKVGSAIISGAKKMASAAASGAAAAKALLLRPIGLAAGTATIGTAAVGAAYFMDKYSRQMMDAQTDEVKSEAALSMQRGRMKRQNPQAYELVKMREKIENMSVLRDNQKDPLKKARTQAAIDEMKKRYQDKFHEYSGQEAPSTETPGQPGVEPEPVKEPSKTGMIAAAGAVTAGALANSLSKTSSTGGGAGVDISKIPIAAGAMGAGISTGAAMNNAMPQKAETSFAGLVTELRSGRLASILEDIRDGIKDLKGMMVPQNGQSKQMSSNQGGSSANVAGKSSIAQQRDTIREAY